MFYDRTLVEALESLSSIPWQGFIFRHVFADNDPLLENRRGARWNPPDVPAIYASLKRDTVLAEAEYQIAAQPLRPKARRTVYMMHAELHSAIDLSDPASLAVVGLQISSLANSDLRQCQLVGGATEWLGRDGLLVPSARAQGINLVIFPNKHSGEIQVVDSEVISE